MLRQGGDGYIHHHTNVVYSYSGSISAATANSTGSVEIQIEKGAFRLTRLQVMCSQSVADTHYKVALYEAPVSTITGSDWQHNAWTRAVEYLDCTGSWDYQSYGADQSEDDLIIIPYSGSTITLFVIPDQSNAEFIYKLCTESACKFV